MSRFVLTAQLQLQAPTNTAQVVRQIQSQLNNVQVNVQVQGTAQATRQVNQVAQSINAANSAASNLGRTFAISVRRFTALAVATRAVSLFTNTLANATDEAIQFERELVRVSQVTGKTVAQLRDFTKEITSLATGLGVSSTSLIKVGTILAQAGFNAEQTTIALRTLAKTELSPTFENMTETAEGVVAIFSQFKQGAEALETQLSSINAVAAAFAVEAGDLIGAVRRVGGVFRASGGDLNELIALFTSVRATTRESAESIATGLRTIFTRIQRPKTIEFLKQYGVQLFDLEGKFVGPFEAVKRLSSALAGLEQGDITFIRIAEELGGFRQIGKVIPLIQQFQIAQDALNVAQKGSTSLSADAASAQAALAIRITKVKEEFLALVRSITETSSFQLFANTALNLASALIKLADALKPIIPLLTAVATIKLAQGVSGFIGGFGRGIGSGRTFNQGGKVLKFARGGMVPGSGNRDTVPAMLQPGEFVIRKSSVNKLGAGNLAAMNENRYANGGKLVKDIAKTTGTSQQLKNSIVSTSEQPFRQGSSVNANDSFNANLSWNPITKKMVENDIKNKKVPSNTLSKLLSESNNEKGDAFENYLVQSRRTILKRTINPIYPVDFASGPGKYAEAKNIKTTLPDDIFIDKLFRARVADKSYRNLNETPSSEDKQNINLGNLKVFYRKFAFGGKARNFGIAALEGSPITKSVELSINDIANKLPSKQPQNNNLIRGILGAKGVNSISITGQSDLMQLSDPGIKDTIYNTIKNNVYGLINQSAQSLSQATNVPLANRKVPINPNKILNKIGTDSVMGSIFEGALAFLGGPFVSGKSTSAIDFPRGLGNLSSAFANLNNMPVDAKKTSNTENINKLLNTKAPNYFADFIKRDPRYKQLISQKQSTNFAKLKGREFDLTTFQRITGNQKATIKDIEDLDVISRKSGNRTLFTLKNLGGIIQKFAKGGMAQPLIDDIVNATGTMMPRPSSAIAALIRAGGGAVDIDRTIKRTIGDKAYGSAKTTGQQSAALDKFFRDPQARLRDVKSAPLTQFGKELQAAIKSGQLQPGKLSIVSKSVRVPGIAEYLSQLFGIPLGNMIFTQGGSKQPAMDALRSKGPRASRVARFAGGGDIGTDTVPALLTPGEFVINKKSAQAIGYGSLNRMNKVGKYAKGGVVQKFAKGGAAGSAAATMAVKVDAGLSKKEVARINMAMAKNSDVFNLLADDINRFNLTVEEARAAYISLARSINAGKKSEDALEDARDSAHKQIVKSAPGIGKADRTQQAAPNLSSRLAGYKVQQEENKVQQEEKQTSRRIKKQLIGNKYGGMAGLVGGGSSGTPMSGKDLGMMAVGLTSVTAALQSMLPPLDENSSAFTKLAHSSLSLVTQIGAAVFALNTFGISLNKQSAMKFLGGGGLGGGGKQSVFNFARGLGISKNMSGTITGVVNGLSKLAGPLLAVAGSAYAAKTAFDAVIKNMYDFDGRLKKSVEKGNVSEAGRIAEEKATFEGASAVRGVGAGVGATIGFALGGPFGAALGAGLGAAAGTLLAAALPLEALDTFSVALGGNTRDSIVKFAQSQAGAVAAQKALNKAQDVATDSMDRFNKGTLSAAEALAEIRNATREVEVQEKRASDFAVSNTKNRSTGGFAVARDVLSLGGLLFENSTARNTRLGEESAGQIKEASRLEAERFQLESPARQASIREAAARRVSVEDIKQQQTSGLQVRANELAEIVASLEAAGDKQGAQAAKDALNQLTSQINQTNREVENIEKEIRRAREAFDAMNLGLRSATATATGASTTLTRFANSLQVGGSTLVSDVEFLSTAMTSAAQAMNPDDIKSAINSVAGTLEKFGVSEKFVPKFRSNTEAFVKAQQNYASSVKNIISRNKEAGKSLSSVQFKEEIGKELTRGLGDVAAENLKKVINNIELTPEETQRVLDGDTSVFGDKLSEATQKQFEEITKIAQELQKAEAVLIDLTKKRIDAERNLVQAQKEAIDLYMEGRDIQASAGGPAVTAQERRGAILRKANVELAGAGLGDIGQASAADFRAISNEMLNRTAEFQTKASTEGGLQGVEGTKAAEQQANLQKAYKSQIETVRALVKLEQDELKLIKEKNNLEKSSIDALISGDIDKFFEQQAAVGAQAAIATGSSTLQNAFGASALGAAAQETRRLQESGVQELYGQRLAGPGGLTERAFGAALGSMGVDNQRMASVAAGTTAEENAANARLRELGGVLGELGGVGEAMATMEVASATMNVQNAEIKLQDITDRGNAAAERAGGMYRGGVVYANRGIFVPRGTDTVPAMLTPGEFVVRRQAVQRGNNLQILQAMNRGGATQSSASGSIGMANGGQVRYRQNGSNGPESGGVGFGISPEIINRLSQSLDKFNTDLSSNIDKLNNTTFNVKLDSTNINVNLTGTSFLSKLTEDLKSDLYKFVGQEIQSYGVDNGGKLKRKSGPIA